MVAVSPITCWVTVILSLTHHMATCDSPGMGDVGSHMIRQLFEQGSRHVEVVSHISPPQSMIRRPGPLCRHECESDNICFEALAGKGPLADIAADASTTAAAAEAHALALVGGHH
eukprot:s1004_g7.t1